MPSEGSIFTDIFIHLEPFAFQPLERIQMAVHARKVHKNRHVLARLAILLQWNDDGDDDDDENAALLKRE